MYILGAAITRPLRSLFIMEVGATSAQLGLIMALPSIVSVLIRIPVSAISHRLGRWRLMLFSIALSVGTTALFAFIQSPIWFFPVVSLSALSWSVFSPIAVVMVSERSTSTTRGSTMGIYFTSIGAAMFFGPLLSSVFTLFLELRQLFLASSVFPIFALTVFLLTVKSGEMKESQMVDTGKVVKNGGSWRRLVGIFKIKNVVALSSARIAFSFAMSVFYTIFPIYADGVLGLTPSLISLLFSFRGITNVLIRMPIGTLSDRIGRRKPFYLAYVIIIAVFAILPYTKNFTVLAVVMGLYGIGWGMRVAPSTALLSESVTSEERPLALAMYMTMFDLGSTIGALFVGFTANILSPPNMMLICAPIMFFALVIFCKISSETIKSNRIEKISSTK